MTAETGVDLMSNRKQIKKQHEQSIVAGFLAVYNRANGTQFSVVAEPEPPEAIARDGENCLWLEVTDAFWTSEYARDIYSFATPGENHVPVRPGPYVEMDHDFIEKFMDVLKAKLSKPNYKPFYEEYGPGVLLVGINHPFFNEETLASMRSHYTPEMRVNETGYFGWVYLMSSGNYLQWDLT